MLIVPKKRIWTQQPQYPAQIDFGNPITKALAFVDNAATFANAKSVSRNGLCHMAGSAAMQPGITFPSGYAASSGLTLLSVGFLNGTANVTNPQFGIRIGSVNAIGFGLGLDAYAGNLSVFGRASYSDYSYETIPATAHGVSVNGGGLTLGLTYKRGTIGGLRALINGKLLTTVDTADKPLFSNDIPLEIHSAGGGTNNSGYLTTLNLFFKRTLSDEEIASLSENPWQIFRAPDSRIFVPTGAGAGGGDSLIASSIIASPAVVSSPLLSQKHALTASSITTAPTVVANPAIIQRHALSSTAVSASPAVVGLPSITQRHALSSTAISAAPAVVGLPTLTEIAAGVLSALPIVSAPAVVGAPAITQKHALSAGAISAGPATFGTPTLAQQHALMAQGITASPSAVGAPVLSEGGAAPFTAEQLLYLDANYVTIANISDIAAAVLAAIQATAIPVNVKQVNDVTIKGIGTQSNPWNPV